MDLGGLNLSSEAGPLPLVPFLDPHPWVPRRGLAFGILAASTWWTKRPRFLPTAVAFPFLVSHRLLHPAAAVSKRGDSW